MKKHKYCLLGFNGVDLAWLVILFPWKCLTFVWYVITLDLEDGNEHYLGI